MPAVWTSARIEQLFLLLVNDLKTIDCNQLAQKWASVYPNDDYKPTDRAISEKIKELKKKVQGTTATTAPKTLTPDKVASTANTTPGSKRSRATPKTPASSSKRARSRYRYSEDETSNQEDTDEDNAQDLSPKGLKRGAPSRRGGRVQSYHVESSENEADRSVDKESLNHFKMPKAIAKTLTKDMSAVHVNGDGDVRHTGTRDADIVAVKPFIARSNLAAKNSATLPKLDYFDGAEDSDGSALDLLK